RRKAASARRSLGTYRVPMTSALWSHCLGQSFCARPIAKSRSLGFMGNHCENAAETGDYSGKSLTICCGELDPRAVIRQIPGEWHPHMHQRLDEEELADWRAGRNAGLSARGTDNRRAPRGG